MRVVRGHLHRQPERIASGRARRRPPFSTKRPSERGNALLLGRPLLRHPDHKRDDDQHERSALQQQEMPSVIHRFDSVSRQLSCSDEESDDSCESQNAQRWRHAAREYADDDCDAADDDEDGSENARTGEEEVEALHQARNVVREIVSRQPQGGPSASSAGRGALASVGQPRARRSCLKRRNHGCAP